MPEASSPALRLVADLVLEVGDERGTTTATLTGDETGLVLDVDDPATLARCAPRRAWPTHLLRSVPGESLAGVPVRLTSRGRTLARVRLTDGGRLRVQPSPSGVPAALRTALSTRSGRLAAGGATAVVLGVVAYLGWRRRGS